MVVGLAVAQFATHPPTDQGCKPASNFDQRPAPNVDHAKRRQAHDSHREMSLELWSVFDARWAKSLVKLQRLFTMLAPRRRPGVPESGRRCAAKSGHQGSHARPATAAQRTTPGRLGTRCVPPARVRRRLAPGTPATAEACQRENLEGWNSGNLTGCDRRFPDSQIARLPRFATPGTLRDCQRSCGARGRRGWRVWKSGESGEPGDPPPAQYKVEKK